jgi:hypothetical protein
VGVTHAPALEGRLREGDEASGDEEAVRAAGLGAVVATGLAAVTAGGDTDSWLVDRTNSAR